MAEIPSTIEGVLDPLLEHRLVRSFSEGPSTYFVVEQSGEFEAAVSLVEMRDGAASVRYADDDLLAAIGDSGSIEAVGAAIRSRSAQELRDALPDLDSPTLGTLSTTAVTEWQVAINEALAASASRGVGDPQMSSRDHAPAATNSGRLACAWAVNRIAERVLGKPIGGSLSTTNMYGVLKTQDALQSRSSARPGAVVISPTAGNNVGHVGILGRNGEIFSNSSSRGRWEQNFTTDKWQGYYGGQKGLPVLYYHVNPARFPGAPIA